MRHKKTFSCGHRGFGKYCHLCKAIKDSKLIKLDSGKFEQVKKDAEQHVRVL